MQLFTLIYQTAYRMISATTVVVNTTHFVQYSEVSLARGTDYVMGSTIGPWKVSSIS